MEHLLDILSTLWEGRSWRTLTAAAIVVAGVILAGVTGNWWLLLVGLALCWLPFLGVQNPEKL